MKIYDRGSHISEFDKDKLIIIFIKEHFRVQSMFASVDFVRESSRLDGSFDRGKTMGSNNSQGG